MNKSFDHKPIHLDFRKPIRKIQKNLKISNSILGDPDLPIVVKLAAVETYTQNAVQTELHTIFGNRDPYRLIGNMWQSLRSAGPHPKILPEEEITIELIENREAELRTIANNLDSFSFTDLENIELSCERDTFMETLLNNIRNEVTSYQHFI